MEKPQKWFAGNQKTHLPSSYRCVFYLSICLKILYIKAFICKWQTTSAYSHFLCLLFYNIIIILSIVFAKFRYLYKFSFILLYSSESALSLNVSLSSNTSQFSSFSVKKFSIFISLSYKLFIILCTSLIS